MTKFLQTQTQQETALYARGKSSLLRVFKLTFESVASLSGSTRYDANAGIWHEWAYAASRLPRPLRRLAALMINTTSWLQRKLAKTAPALTWLQSQRDTQEMLTLSASLYADVLSTFDLLGLPNFHAALRDSRAGVVVAISESSRPYLILAIAATSARNLGRTVVDERLIGKATFGPWTKEIWKNLNIVAAKPHQLLSPGQLHRTNNEKVIVITNSQTAQTLKEASQRVVVSAQSEEMGKITFC